MATDVIDAPPKLDLLLDLAPHPERHWEGRFDFRDDDGAEQHFNLIADLRFGGGVFEGGGKVSLEGESNTIDIEISGKISGEPGVANVSFAMWLVHELARSQHFTCSGRLSADETAIEGRHSYPCWDPENCGCAGGDGVFAMRRVDGQTRAEG